MEAYRFILVNVETSRVDAYFVTYGDFLQDHNYNPSKEVTEYFGPLQSNQRIFVMLGNQSDFTPGEPS